MAFAVPQLLPAGPAAGVHEKERVLRTLFALLRPLSSTVVREAYLAEIARLLGLDPRPVLRDFEQFQLQSEVRLLSTAGGQTPGPSADAPKKIPHTGKLRSVTGDLLSLVLHHGELGAPLAALIPREWLDAEDPDGGLFWQLLEKCREGTWPDWDHVGELFAPQDGERLYTVLAVDDALEDPWGAANLCLRRLYRDYLQRKIGELSARAPEGAGTDFWEELMRQKMEWRRKMQHPPQLPSPGTT